MAQAERLYKIKRLLDGGRCVEPARLQQSLEVSAATLKRDIRHLRERMNAPVFWCRERRGWYLDRSRPTVGSQYELPGFWLSADEIHALLTMQHLLSNLDSGGLLGGHITPLMERLSKMLDGGVPAGDEVARRIRIQTVGARRVHVPHFQAVGSALLRRKRMVIHYFGRRRSGETVREVSPQRLVHYRDNWYLDAWCHWRNALRSFSADSIKAVSILERPAMEVEEAELDFVLGSGYGIFSGASVKWATLRFSSERARWVAAETWHPEQHGEFDEQRRWLLTLPYSDPTELVMDIMRHLPEVDVLAPASLDSEVRRRVREAMVRWNAG